MQWSEKIPKMLYQNERVKFDLPIGFIASWGLKREGWGCPSVSAKSFSADLRDPKPAPSDRIAVPPHQDTGVFSPFFARHRPLAHSVALTQVLIGEGVLDSLRKAWASPYLAPGMAGVRPVSHRCPKKRDPR